MTSSIGRIGDLKVYQDIRNTMIQKKSGSRQTEEGLALKTWFWEKVAILTSSSRDMTK